MLKTTASGTIYFLYGQTGLLAEYQSNGDFIQGYGYNPKGSYTTNPQYTLTPKASSTGYDVDFYHNDHLATPQKLTNSTGAISWAMESSAFGEATIKTQTTKNNLRFPGQYADDDIGLSQNYFRDYAPSLGRYVESDPIGLEGGVNFYGYSKYSPLSYIDYTGQEAFYGSTACIIFMDCGEEPEPPVHYPGTHDYSFCQYYKNINNSQKCNYHNSAYNICMGGGLHPFYRSANSLLNKCAEHRGLNPITVSNCVRNCLKNRDEKARNNENCKLIRCDGGICTKRKCIDNYHQDCFKECGVNPNCYGGNWDFWPFHDIYYDD